MPARDLPNPGQSGNPDDSGAAVRQTFTRTFAPGNQDLAAIYHSRSAEQREAINRQLEAAEREVLLKNANQPLVEKAESLLRLIRHDESAEQYSYVLLSPRSEDNGKRYIRIERLSERNYQFTYIQELRSSSAFVLFRDSNSSCTPASVSGTGSLREIESLLVEALAAAEEDSNVYHDTVPQGQVGQQIVMEGVLERYRDILNQLGLSEGEDSTRVLELENASLLTITRDGTRVFFEALYSTGRLELAFEWDRKTDAFFAAGNQGYSIGCLLRQIENALESPGAQDEESLSSGS